MTALDRSVLPGMYYALTQDQDHSNIELWRTGCQEVSKGLFKKYFILYPHHLLPGSTTTKLN